MSGLTRYEMHLWRDLYGTPNVIRIATENGQWYAKDEADARIAELEGYAKECDATIATLEADRADLEAEVARLREDAERYRWLKENAADSHMWGDATIDAARAKK